VHMSKQVNKTTVGIFMVSAVALLVAAVLILGSGKFFQDRPVYVMFFKGSLSGLSVGSPVVFRGVKMGEVKAIKLSFNPKDLSASIPVIVELGQADIDVEGRTVSDLRSQKGLTQKLIEKGLRGQLAMQSFVTGQLMITLDFYPEKPAVFVGTEKKYTEIPTVPTPLQELTRKLEKLPIEDILKKVDEAMTGITKVVNSPEITAIMSSVDKGLGEVRSLVRNVDKQVGPAAASITETAAEFRKVAIRIEGNIEPLVASLKKTSDEAGTALVESQGVLGKADDFMSGDSAMGYRLIKALEEFEAAVKSIRVLADTLDRRPEALIFGKESKKEAAK
jgi:paraquat-inducible protein B